MATLVKEEMDRENMTMSGASKVVCANCRQNLIPMSNMTAKIEQGNVDEQQPIFEISLDIEEIHEDPHFMFRSTQRTTTIKVKDALSAVYKLMYLDMFTNSTMYIVQDNFLEKPDEDVAVCPRCAGVLTNLFKYYNEFNQLRQVDTYLSKRVELLDVIIQSQVQLTRAQDFNSVVPPEVVTEVIVEVDGEELLLEDTATNFQVTHETDHCDYEEQADPSYSESSNCQVVAVVSEQSSMLPPSMPENDCFNSSPSSSNISSLVLTEALPTTVLTTTTPEQSSLHEELLSHSPVSSQGVVGPWIKLHRMTAKDVEKARVTTPTSVNGRPSRIKKLSRHLNSDFVHFGDASPLKEEGSDSEFEFEGNENSAAEDGEEEEEFDDNDEDEPFEARQQSTQRATKYKSKTKSRSSARSKRRRSVGTVVETMEATIPCTECDKMFRRKFDLKKHLESSHPEVQLHRCDQCDKSFVSEKDLENHSYLHSGQKPLSCPICGKSYLIKKHYKRHLSSHNPGGEPFKCPTCDESFSEKFQLKVHLKRHNKDTLFPCTVCQKAFQSLIHLKNHHKLRHSEATEMPFKCSVPACDKEFRGRQALKNHMMESHTDTPFICPNCGLPFAQDSDLSSHLAACRETKAVSCPKCEESFRSIHYLKTHMIVHGEKSFTCNVCQRMFYSAQKLKMHSYIHSGERPYTCTICQKGFISSNNLKMHFQVHTGEKKQLCAHCGAGFAQKPALDRHIMLVHSDERPHVCMICNKSFKILQLLQRHKKTHVEKSNLCPQCGKSFALGQTLKRHLQTHTGEKPYKCQICGLSFPDNRPLKKHMLTHGLSEPIQITTGLDPSSTVRATVWCAENVVLTENIEIDF